MLHGKSVALASESARRAISACSFRTVQGLVRDRAPLSRPRDFRVECGSLLLPCSLPSALCGLFAFSVLRFSLLRNCASVTLPALGSCILSARHRRCGGRRRSAPSFSLASTSHSLKKCQRVRAGASNVAVAERSDLSCRFVQCHRESP